jgi:O-antigen/teichoic acid export membrane protein
MHWSGRSFGPAAAIRRLSANRLLRYNAIYLGGTLMAGGLGYVFHFATGRLLGPAAYAVVASALAALYILTLPALVVQIVSARFTSLAAARGQLGNIPRLLVQVSALGLGVGLPIAGAMAVFTGPLTGYLQISDRRVFYTLIVASLVAPLLTATRGALQGLRRFLALSINTVLDMAVRVGGATALILAGFGSLGGAAALVLGPFTAYAQSLFMFRGLRGAASGPRASFGQVSSYAATSAIAAIGTTYLYNADVVLSKHYLVATAAGIYAAASVLGRVAYFLGLTVTQVMFPEVATLHARDEPHFHVVDLSLGMLVAVSLGLMLVYAAVPGVVLLPFGGAFTPVEHYLWPFALALGLLAIANLLTNYFLSIGSARFAVPLILACVAETALISVFHAGVGQILWMVVITMAGLVSVLGGMYAAERLRTPAPKIESDQVPC